MYALKTNLRDRQDASYFGNTLIRATTDAVSVCPSSWKRNYEIEMSNHLPVVLIVPTVIGLGVPLWFLITQKQFSLERSARFLMPDATGTLKEKCYLARLPDPC